MAGFFEGIFGFAKKPAAQKTSPKINLNKRNQFNREYVTKFAEKLSKDFKSRKYADLNSDQKAILEELQHQLKQYLKELQKEGANAEKNLKEIAHEIFVIACACEISMEEVAQFFADAEFSVADLNKFNKSGKLNALAAALLGRRNKKYFKWLIALGANVNFQSPEGNNLAHFAASIGIEAEMMEFLIKECEVDINAHNNDGMSALDIAMMRIDRDLITCLKENGGECGLKNMFAKDDKEKTDDKAPEPEKELSKEEMLHNAVLSGDVAAVGSLILDGANVNSVQGGETILQTAARAGNWAITEKVADRANVITKENVRGVSDAMGQMIDNAGSLQSHVNNPFHHQGGNSQSGGMGR